MEKKMNNEELQSRREFFKKAAKGALPILGAIALASMPGVVKAAEEAPMDCQYSCSGGCSGLCYSGCRGTCYGDCNTGCKNNCYTGCTNSCHGTCHGGCARSAYA